MRLVWPGRGQPGPADGSTRPPGPQSPGPEGATFPCSVSQKPVSFAPSARKRGGGRTGNWKFSIPAFDTGFESVHNLKFSAGGVPEWLKGADCKSVGLAPTLVRIQPPPPETLYLNPGAARASAAWILKCKPRELGGLCNEGRKASGVWI